MSIKRFTESCMEGGGVAPHANGEYVKYEDHIASHAYGEAKERELNSLFGAAKEMLRIAGIANQGSSAYNRAIINLHEVMVDCAKSRAGIQS